MTEQPTPAENTNSQPKVRTPAELEADRAEKARLRAEKAAAAADKAARKYHEIKIDRIVQDDPRYMELSRNLGIVTRKLCLQRVGRARKRDSIKASERRIKTRRTEIEQHNRAELQLIGELDRIHTMMNERRRAVARDLPRDSDAVN